MDNLQRTERLFVRIAGTVIKYVDSSTLNKPANDNFEQFALPLEYGNDNEKP